MAKNKTSDLDQPADTPAASPVESAPAEGREVALFVCIVCGKEKRGQKHYNFACEPCVSSR